MAADDMKLIPYIMHWKQVPREEAEAWADKYCGDWRNNPENKEDE